MTSRHMAPKTKGNQKDKESRLGYNSMGILPAK